MRPTAPRLRSAIAIVAVLALTIGIPVLLIVVAGWPLPRQIPNWDAVSTAIQQGDLPGGIARGEKGAAADPTGS
jgi:hypothetical protein